jgi:hypothetical protein
MEIITGPTTGSAPVLEYDGMNLSVTGTLAPFGMLANGVFVG